MPYEILPTGFQLLLNQIVLTGSQLLSNQIVPTGFQLLFNQILSTGFQLLSNQIVPTSFQLLSNQILVLLFFTAWNESKYVVFSGPYFHVFSPNTGKYRPEKTLYLDTFRAVFVTQWINRNQIFSIFEHV